MDGRNRASLEMIARPSVSSPRIINDKLRDSRIWNYVNPRPTDIIIASCYKVGTTVAQQIVNLLVHGHDEFDSLHKLSPWVEESHEEFLEPQALQNLINHLENLPDPRFFKSHLSFDGLPYYPEWKYIYLARDGRDVGLSLFNMCLACVPDENDPSYKKRCNIYGKPINFGEFWDRWIETGEPLWCYWEHLESWWQVRHLPNVLLVHFSNLVNDKPNEICRIAKFLNVPMDEETLDYVMRYSSLEYMKQNWEKFEPPGVMRRNLFFNKGSNGRWKDLLTPAQIEYYENFIFQRLGHECANWVKNGTFLA